MQKSELQRLPVGLSGIMSYEHVALGTHKVELNTKATLEGKFVNVVVDSVDKSGMDFHIETNLDGLAEQANNNFVVCLQLLEYANVFGEKRLVYYKNR